MWQWKKIQKMLPHVKGRQRTKNGSSTKFIPVYTQLDQLSNSVVDLIKQNRLDEAEAVSHKLLTDYPDQVDGLNLLAMVYEARGEKGKAADYFRKAADFAKSNPGFDRQMVNWFLSEARRMEK